MDGSSGEGLANNSHLDENELAEVHVRRVQEISKSREKGKAIFDLNEPAWPNEETLSNIFENNGENLKDCEHSWIWKQGYGHHCWICGVIDKNHQVPPGFDASNYKDIKLRVPKEGFSGTGIFPQRMHQSYMLSHHIEILNFLCTNLAVVENPNGCILAQAPISEKTFLMISFIDGYLAKHANSKPLFVLPKSMINFWKKEFDRLKVNDVLLLDFYSVKANRRSQQLNLLKQWITDRSILFLGHRQFYNMVFDSSGTQASTQCRDIILNVPSLVIFDRGTDPRNEMMSFLQAIASIKTPLKVLLTGTLYQNHITEVFNILHVAFPEFLKRNHLGKNIRRFFKVDDEADGPSTIPLFGKLEESFLCQDTDDSDKSGYLTELRKLTNKVIYNHKGEFLLEVPSLMDFTVVLKPTLSQMSAWKIERKSKGKGFKTYSTLSGITLHPALCAFSERVKGLPAPKDDEMDEILKYIDVNDGVKTKFFLGLVKLCGYTNEKILVVSQYVIPLIFLQRLMAKINGWKDGKETFMIKGDTRPSAREISINQFNNSSDAKVFFASIKACSEDITLTGATRIVMLDIIANPCMARQTIELSHHPGQQNKVYSYRLVAADTSEEEEDIIAATKEIISGIWLDGKTYPVDGTFQIPTIDGDYCNDNYLASSYMREDIKTIYKRLVFGFGS
ncbi:Protein CHROMATIN REMODELING 35 [Cardamine amara subsp. amara]|uniref:Protein CHROMATIN REMODELING 35 n=1 Tax=Cardamine amara subsp. amara TaxID=228776 RepID=A0ABD1C5E3_CARAN